MPVNLFPVLLITHITLAISLFLPSFLLPFTLRTRRATVESESGLVRKLLWAQSHDHQLHMTPSYGRRGEVSHIEIRSRSVDLPESGQ